MRKSSMTGCRGIHAAIAAVVLTAAGSADALTQPDGTVVPQSDRLATILAEEGEAIDPLVDAATTPETFTPQCSLTFTVLARGGGQLNSFGWYNVTGSKPELADLVEFIGCNEDVGTEKVLDVRSHPRYAGGDIAFFLATTQGKIPPNCADFNNPDGTIGYVYYSQKQFNPDNALAPGGESFIHLLIMDSKLIPDAFYFGWEDLVTTSDQSDNDNDFEDLLMRVQGIQCTGGGQPCDTQQTGICALGTTQCINGAIECVQNQQPVGETCNAVDDDCDGQIDNGDLCDGDEVCFRGTCVPPCGSGEFSCPAGTSCNTQGLCEDPLCIGVSCDPGQVCLGGVCKAACDDVVCPFGQLCWSGACIDPCEAITCDADYVCKLGVCELRCGCTGCESGYTCADSAALCVQDSCVDADCAEGTHCEDGACVDNCSDATCPTGTECVAGSCVAAQADGGAGQGGSGGFNMGGSGGDGAGAGGLVDAGVDASGGQTFQDAPAAATSDGGGCGCRVSDRQGSAGMAAFLGLLSLLLGRRKRGSA